MGWESWAQVDVIVEIIEVGCDYIGKVGVFLFQVEVKLIVMFGVQFGCVYFVVEGVVVDVVGNCFCWVRYLEIFVNIGFELSMVFLKYS